MTHYFAHISSESHLTDNVSLEHWLKTDGLVMLGVTAVVGIISLVVYKKLAVERIKTDRD